jgi:hypothetical protein
MSIRLSTSLVNYLASGGSLKKAFSDGCIDIYNGVQPATADSASGALLLCRITYQGGAFTPAVPSTAKKDKLVINSAVNALTYGYIVNGGTPYSVTAVVPTDTAATVATKLAALINASAVVFAIDDGAGEIIIQERFAGVGFISSSTGTGSLTLTPVTASARSTGIQFGGVAVGALSKEAGAWQGSGLQAGLAGWGRIKSNQTSGFDDDSTGTTFIRLDFAINTANSDMIALSSLNMVAGVTSTVDTCVLTIPQS